MSTEQTEKKCDISIKFIVILKSRCESLQLINLLRIVEWTKRKVASEEGKKKNLILFCLQLLQTYSRILTTINIGKDFAWSHTMFELHLIEGVATYVKAKNGDIFSSLLLLKVFSVFFLFKIIVLISGIIEKEQTS